MKTPSTVSRVIVAMAIAVAFLLAVCAWLFHYLAVSVPVDLAKGAKEQSLDTARRIENGLRSVFNFTPQITVNNTTVVEQATPVMELATVQQGVVVHYQWSQAWFGSTKTMELQGIYQAKAGFNLHGTFRVSVEPSRIVATLPAPELLSLEMKNYKVITDEDGWWNKINSGDRENAIAAMQQQARTKVVESGLLDQAKEKFKKQLDEAIVGQGISLPVEVVYETTLPVEPIYLAKPTATPAASAVQ